MRPTRVKIARTGESARPFANRPIYHWRDRLLTPTTTSTIPLTSRLRNSLVQFSERVNKLSEAFHYSRPHTAFRPVNHFQPATTATRNYVTFDPSVEGGTMLCRVAGCLCFSATFESTQVERIEKYVCEKKFGFKGFKNFKSFLYTRNLVSSSWVKIRAPSSLHLTYVVFVEWMTWHHNS